jgi:DNA polymerase-4
MAMKLYPQAKIMKGGMELYPRLFHDITEIIKEKAPMVEKASIDEFYMDIAGMDKFHGSCKWTNELAHTIIKEPACPSLLRRNPSPDSSGNPFVPGFGTKD